VIVGVVGAGTMGAGIAQTALQAGHEVLLNDVDEPAIERGRERINAGLERLVEKGRLDAGMRDAALGRLRHAHDLASLAGESDLVIEAAFEDLGLKRELFRALDAGARPETILTTNTSALSVAEIAQVTQRENRILGLHFFNPAPVMPLVEVVTTERTAPEMVAAAVEFTEGLGKVAVVCRDSPGFIVNRVNRPFTLEALRMLEEGEAGVGEIDQAVRAAGYPMGPFELMDLVGIDVNFAVARTLFDAFGAERFRPSPIQEALVTSGTLGRKTRKGFYTYEHARAARPTHGIPGVSPAVIRDTPRRLSTGEISHRIQMAIINEAYFAAGERVAEPRDIDRALKLGASHPKGPFELAGEFGLRHVVESLQRYERTYGERFRVAPALWQVAHV
jgi:3-hydroxybutyryl-CoA dehydrogenase